MQHYISLLLNHPLWQEVSYTVVQQNKNGQACFSENKQVSAIPLLFITADQRYKSEKILLGNCQHGVITRRWRYFPSAFSWRRVYVLSDPHKGPATTIQNLRLLVDGELVNRTGFRNHRPRRHLAQRGNTTPQPGHTRRDDGFEVLHSCTNFWSKWTCQPLEVADKALGSSNGVQCLASNDCAFVGILDALSLLRHSQQLLQQRCHECVVSNSPSVLLQR